MKYIVDMQGFKQPGNDFVLKELAIIPLEEDAQPLIFPFKEPFPWKPFTDKYKEEKAVLSWYFLEFRQSSLPTSEVFFENVHDATQVLAMGSIKKKWLERFRCNVRDVTEMGFPPLDKIKLVTIYPNHEGVYKTSCALHNVKLLKKFYDNCARKTSMDWEYMLHSLARQRAVSLRAVSERKI